MRQAAVSVASTIYILTYDGLLAILKLEYIYEQQKVDKNVSQSRIMLLIKFSCSKVLKQAFSVLLPSFLFVCIFFPPVFISKS